MQTTAKKRQLTIWSFIGFILMIYGLVIAGAGVYYLTHTPLPTQLKPTTQLALSHLNPSLWWGLFLLLVGIIFNWIDLKNSRKG